MEDNLKEKMEDDFKKMIEDNLKKIKMEDYLKKREKGRRPQAQLKQNQP